MSDSRFSQKGKIWRDFAEESGQSDGSEEGSSGAADLEEDSGDEAEDKGNKTKPVPSASKDRDSRRRKLKQQSDSDGDEEGHRELVGKEERKSSKRRREDTRHVVAAAAAAEDDDDDDDEEEDDDDEEDDGDEDDGDDDDDKRKASKDKDKDKGEDKGKGKDKKSALRKEAQQYRDQLEQRGVLYMSRVPSKMKPDRCRELFQEHGEVTRIFLAEEDASVQKRRAANGGSTARHFAEGWVEYASKKVAKRVAACLNNTPISNRKGSAHVDERWNLKYLRKFKWDYLTEKLAYERRVREAKMKAAMLQAKRSNAEFAEWVEKGKATKHAKERMDRKRQKSGAEAESGGGGAGAGGDSDRAAAAASSKKPPQPQQQHKRTFKQVRSLAVTHGENSQLVGAGLLAKVWRKGQ